MKMIYLKNLFEFIQRIHLSKESKKKKRFYWKTSYLHHSYPNSTFFFFFSKLQIYIFHYNEIIGSQICLWYVISQFLMNGCCL